MGKFKYVLILAAAFLCTALSSEAIRVPRLKYSGGGDWYNGKTEIPNLMKRFRDDFKVDVDDIDMNISAISADLLLYPMIFITGHGRIVFTDLERSNLRKYAEAGGLLYIDDDCGMDKFIRSELKKIFPDRELMPLPADFPLFSIYYVFEKGIPQIHMHEEKPPEAFGIFDDNGNLMVLYTFNANISDGWDSKGVHSEDTEEIRETALRMGVNILLYSLLY